MKFLIVLMILMSSAMAQVNYLAPQTLDKTVKTQVQDCSNTGTIKLPIITWGADVVAVAANGNAKTTQTGSIFADRKLDVELVREDVLSKQLENYLACKSPFARGTMDMISQMATVANKNPKTKMRVLMQLSWSAGADMLVVGANIKKPSDLRNKTIALQLNGPHSYYLAKVLADAGLSLKDVKLKYTKDLTGTDQTPTAAMQSGSVDAAMVISPDAGVLTSNFSVGNGSESSVKGATVLLSTKTANRVIADVYAVREDYYQANKDTVFKLIDGLYKAEEKVAQVLGKNGDKAAASALLKASAKILLDSEQAVADTQGMYSEAQGVGFSGNKAFFEDVNNPRGFSKLTQEVQTSLVSMGLMTAKESVAMADWSMTDFKKGLLTADKAKTPTFDATKVASLISKKQKQGNLDSGSLFSFEVYFKPNQDEFPMELYKDAFDKVISLSATYAGALITVEGHSDPLGYLKQKKANANQMVLSQVRQSAKNLSVTRSNAVREALIKYSKTKGIVLDSSQLAVVGMGIDSPKSGNCGADPCAPKSEQEWLNNMRVEFRIIQVEAEENVFSPL